MLWWAKDNIFIRLLPPHRFVGAPNASLFCQVTLEPTKEATVCDFRGQLELFLRL